MVGGWCMWWISGCGRGVKGRGCCDHGLMMGWMSETRGSQAMSTERPHWPMSCVTSSIWLSCCRVSRKELICGSGGGGRLLL